MGGTCESKNIEHVRNVAVRSCLNQENKDGHNIPTCSWNHQSGAATIDVTCAEGYKPRGGVPTADPQTQQLLCNSNQWNDFSCARSNSPSIISASNHVTCENRTDGVKCWEFSTMTKIYLVEPSFEYNLTLKREGGAHWRRKQHRFARGRAIVQKYPSISQQGA